MAASKGKTEGAGHKGATKTKASRKGPGKKKLPATKMYGKK